MKLLFSNLLSAVRLQFVLTIHICEFSQVTGIHDTLQDVELRDARNNLTNKRIQNKATTTQLKHSGLCLHTSVRSLKCSLLWYTTRTDVPCCTIPGHKGYLSPRDDSLCVGVYVCIPIYHTQCFRNHTLTL